MDTFPWRYDDGASLAFKSVVVTMNILVLVNSLDVYKFSDKKKQHSKQYVRVLKLRIEFSVKSNIIW